MIKHTYWKALAAACVAISAAPLALAQGAAPSAVDMKSTSAAATDPLYVALGETTGITQLADDFVVRLKAHPRLANAFKDANAKHLKLMLAQQICKVSGGPCVYEGSDMKSAHAELDITRADFNALVEVLQTAMDARGIAFTAQNQLLARFAPMHRDIITVK